MGPDRLYFMKFRKKIITRRRLKFFSAIYTFVVWFCSNLFWALYAGEDVNSGGAAILWGLIFYNYSKRGLENRSRLTENIPAIPKERFQEQETTMGTFVVETETGEVVKERNKTYAIPEASAPPISTVPEGPAEQKRPFPLAICILSCVCITLAACSLWLWHETQNLHTEISNLSEENSKLEAQVSDISQKIEKKDVEYQKLQKENTELERTVASRSTRILKLVGHLDRIGYIVEGSKHYHRFEIDPHSWDGPYYGLSHFRCGGFPDDAEYWAHNVELCKYLGYTPCLTCW